jgi:hypothetical protein
MDKLSTTWSKGGTNASNQAFRRCSIGVLHDFNRRGNNIYNTASPAIMNSSHRPVLWIIEQYGLAVCMSYHKSNADYIGNQGVCVVDDTIIAYGFLYTVYILAMHLVSRNQTIQPKPLFNVIAISGHTESIITNTKADIIAGKRSLTLTAMPRHRTMNNASYRFSKHLMNNFFFANVHDLQIRILFLLPTKMPTLLGTAVWTFIFCYLF